jgi:hypothetical protein
MEIIHKDEGKREIPESQCLLFSLFEEYIFNDDDYSVKRLVLLGR